MVPRRGPLFTPRGFHDHSGCYTAEAMREMRERLVQGFRDALRARLGEDLVSVVLYGSEARGDSRPDSDFDFLVVCGDLPASRLRRADILPDVRGRMTPLLREARSRGLEPYFSVLWKTPEEASRPSLLYLDMVEDARMIEDRDGFFAGVLERLRTRLRERGARRIPIGNSWYWDLKPDYRPGEVFELP